MRIFPGNDLAPLPVKNVYITTFTDQQEQVTYQPVLDLLSEINAIVDTEQNAARYLYDANYRVIALGTKYLLCVSLYFESIQTCLFASAFHTAWPALQVPSPADLIRGMFPPLAWVPWRCGSATSTGACGF